MSMSSMISAQGVAVATAMAVSGTVILLALRLQKSLHEMPPPSPPPPPLRSCISSGRKKTKKKRVHFANDVVESRRDGDGEEFRKKIHSFKPKSPSKPGIPANRVALYNGILRDRVAQRLAYSC